MSTLMLPLLIVAATVGYMVFMKKNLNQKYAHLRFGEVATRLGLQVVEGDPDHNLATQSMQPGVQNLSSARGFLTQMAASQVGGTLGETKLQAVGQPYGLQVELMLYCRQDLDPGLRRATTTTWYDLRLTVHAGRALPPFDLRLRQEAMGLETRARGDGPAWPQQSFGDPALSQRYVIEAADPGLPLAIGGALGALAQLPYVHVTSSGNQLSFVMTPVAVMSSSFSFEPILHTLAQIAAALEGRAVPGALASPQAQVR
ncbi:MAG: hypothetical protein R3B48_29285 [Kofleriaceae bacterium]